MSALGPIADICQTNLAETKATLHSFTHCEWSRPLYRSAFVTVAMVVKISLTTEAWLASMPDELDVDAFAVNVVTFDDHITKIDADPECQPVIYTQFGIAFDFWRAEY
jgi:hypothetical protein